MERLGRIITAAALAAGFVLALAGPGSKVTYKSVKPIFDAKCVGCHRGSRAAGRFAMDSYAGIMKGGEDGKAVVPKNAAASRMIKMIKGTIRPRMPKDKPPLSAAEQKKIADWINGGARP